MPHVPSLGAFALFAVVAVLSLEPPAAPPAPPAGSRAAQDGVLGHLVLVVEGDVRQLSITHAAGKPDPWAGVAKGLASSFLLHVLDEGGAELAVVPLDLSRFDTDPAHIGRPVAVHGCEVRDWRIGALLNVPFLPAASRYVFTRDGVPIGETGAAAVARLLGSDR